MTQPNFWPKPPRKVANRYEYGSLVFWAEGGGVYVLDEHPEPGEDPRKSVTLPRWLGRIEAQQAYLQAAEKDSHIGNAYEIAYKAQHVLAIRGLVTAMKEVARQAKEQGDLTRPDVQRYYRDHVAPVNRTHLVPSIILP